MKRLCRYLAMLLCLNILCTACGGHNTSPDASGENQSAEAGVSTGEMTTEENTEESKKGLNTEESITQEPETEEITTEASTAEGPAVEESTTAEPVTEEATTEEPDEPIDLHTEETQMAGEGIIQMFKMGTTLLADLDGDGTDEKITIRVNTESGIYSKILEAQVNETYYDCEEFASLYKYMENPERVNFYLVDLDTADNWVELALYEHGPSNDPETVFLRYHHGELVYVGRVPSGPPILGEYGGYEMEIAGDGKITGTARLNVIETAWAKRTWKLTEASRINAELEEVIPEYYEFVLYREKEEWLEVKKPLTVYHERQDGSDNVVVLPEGTRLEITRYYPEGQWLELIYDGGDKTAWIRIYEDEQSGKSIILPENVSAWILYQYIEGWNTAD